MKGAINQVIELLSAFTITDILIMVALLAVAIKGAVTFYDWIKNRLAKFFAKEEKKAADAQSVELRFEKDEQRVEGLAQEHKGFSDGIAQLNENMLSIQEAMKNDIKGWITDKHEYYMTQGWIDIRHLESIESRYQDYCRFKGNSFVADLMSEIRKLPTHPPRQ